MPDYYDQMSADTAFEVTDLHKSRTEVVKVMNKEESYQGALKANYCEHESDDDDEDGNNNNDCSC